MVSRNAHTNDLEYYYYDADNNIITDITVEALERDNNSMQRIKKHELLDLLEQNPGISTQEAVSFIKNKEITTSASTPTTTPTTTSTPTPTSSSSSSSSSRNVYVIVGVVIGVVVIIAIMILVIYYARHRGNTTAK
jgi:hypothetical protein